MTMKNGRFTILEEDPAIYPNTCPFPVIYMGTVNVEWAMQCFSWVNMCSAIETISGCQPPQHTQLLPGIHCSAYLNEHKKRSYWASLHGGLSYFFTLENNTYYFTRDCHYKKNLYM
jgi:hypothetical protein